MPAGIAEARIVLKTHIDVRPRLVVSEIGGSQQDHCFEVLRRLAVDAALVVERKTPADKHLCPVAVDQSRANGGANLRSQPQSQAFVALEAAGRRDEPARPAVPHVRRLERAAVITSAFLLFCCSDRGSQPAGESGSAED